MNERIKELAEQADDYGDTYCDTIALSYSNWNTIRDEKFAELLIRECISMADKESERYSNLDQEYCSMAMDNYMELVRQHFGVTE
jgi:hypothetical protein